MKDLITQAHYIKNHRGRSIIVGTISQVEGSAYRREGARKIFDLDSKFTVGLLSGGCLEGQVDQDVFSMATFPQVRVYDTSEIEDRFFGFQKGCQGKLTIRFDKVDWNSENILERYLGFSDNPHFPPTVTNVLGQSEVLTRPFKLFIFGARGGAVSMMELAQTLGWTVIVSDYRKDLVEAFQHPNDVEVRSVQTQNIFLDLPLDERSAVVGMTHNYEFDLELLRQAQSLPFAYLGIIGSRKRFELLKADLKSLHSVELSAETLARIHSPAGEKLARSASPEVISLSVIYQIQTVLSQPS